MPLQLTLEDFMTPSRSGASRPWPAGPPRRPSEKAGRPRAGLGHPPRGPRRGPPRLGDREPQGGRSPPRAWPGRAHRAPREGRQNPKRPHRGGPSQHRPELGPTRSP